MVAARFFDGTFPHYWQAEILSARPLILPTRHFAYPAQAEEVERGALEVLIRPSLNEQAAGRCTDLKGHGFSRAANAASSAPALAAEGMQAANRPFPQGLKPNTSSCSTDGTAKAVPFQNAAGAGKESNQECQPSAQEFLATCALGFRDPAVPTGLWSTPNPDEICAVSGGYAYVIDTTRPERFTMIPYRPVLEVRPVPEQGLLLFVGHLSILAWSTNGQAWQSERLTSEGLTIASIEGHILHGQGWDMMTDKEIPFTLDLRTGLRCT